MPRSPLTETIARVQGMISYVRENLNPGEYDLFLDILVPEPVVEAARPAKKKRKPRAGSKRAASLAEHLKTAGHHDGDRPQLVAEGFTDNGGMAYEAVTAN